MSISNFEKWIVFITLIEGPIICILWIFAINFIEKIRLQKYEDEFNEFESMVEKGTEAWADVPDATEWVEDLRGND